MTATLTKWYEEHGRHEIVAGGKNVKSVTERSNYVVLRDEDVNKKRQTNLDEAGIAKTAREEKIRARDEKLRQQQENERMAKLYRQVVLKEQETGLVQIGVAPAASSGPLVMPETPATPKKEEEVGSFGD